MTYILENATYIPNKKLFVTVITQEKHEPTFISYLNPQY